MALKNAIKSVANKAATVKKSTSSAKTSTPVKKTTTTKSTNTVSTKPKSSSVAKPTVTANNKNTVKNVSAAKPVQPTYTFTATPAKVNTAKQTPVAAKQTPVTPAAPELRAWTPNNQQSLAGVLTSLPKRSTKVSS